MDTTEQFSQKARKDGVSRILVLRQKGGWWLEDRVRWTEGSVERRDLNTFQGVTSGVKLLEREDEPLQRGAQELQELLLADVGTSLAGSRNGRRAGTGGSAGGSGTVKGLRTLRNCKIVTGSLGSWAGSSGEHYCRGWRS